MSLLMALSGQSNRLCVCPLLDQSGQRSILARDGLSAFDRGCVKTCMSQECAELFSLLSSPDSGCQHFWFSNRRKRDDISTRKLKFGVFTQPGTKADNRRFWRGMVCPLMTQQRHWLCTAAMDLMSVSAPIKVLV